MLVLVIVPLYGLVTIVNNRKNKIFTKEIQDTVAEASSHAN